MRRAAVSLLRPVAKGQNLILDLPGRLIPVLIAREVLIVAVINEPSLSSFRASTAAESELGSEDAPLFRATDSNQEMTELPLSVGAAQGRFGNLCRKVHLPAGRLYNGASTIGSREPRLSGSRRMARRWPASSWDMAAVGTSRTIITSMIRASTAT